MAVIKCKMCGGNLKLVEGSTVCECEYCGTKQTVPSVDNEKKLTLFSRAGRLLRACEFDKAAGVFETIVADFPQEAEAYWGLVLCKYGIEYVDDPATGKKIPTCHRSSFESVLKDANFEQACENTDAVARRVYRDEARAIEELRKNIIEVSGKEEPYDVFISYKETDDRGERTPDSELAQKIYRELTREGYRVFFSRISLESHLGTEYEPYIFAALNSAKVMLVVGTDYENFDAVWVKNEWSRFLKLIARGEKKTLIPVYKDMDAYDMPEAFSKLTALDMGRIGAMEDLLHGVEKLLGKKKDEPVSRTVVQGGGPNVTALLKRGQQALEDADWEKAKLFFEQVLSMDAENSDAFLGLAFAEAKCVNEDDYIRRACEREGKQGIAYLPLAKGVIDKAVREYMIPGYLPEETVRGLFKYDLGFPSRLSAQKLIADEEKKRYQNDKNLKRAFLYSNGETKNRLDAFQTRLFSGLDQKVRAAEKREDSIRAENSKENKAYRAYIESAISKARELNRRAGEKREVDYQTACERFSRASSISDYRTCIDLFSYEGLKGYKESQHQIDVCWEQISSLNQKAADKAARELNEKRRAARLKIHLCGTLWLIFITLSNLLLLLSSVALLSSLASIQRGTLDFSSIIIALILFAFSLFAYRTLVKKYRRQYEQYQRPIAYLVIVLILCILLLLRYANGYIADSKIFDLPISWEEVILSGYIVWLISNIRRVHRLERLDIDTYIINHR